MTLKLVGAVLILTTCGGLGLRSATEYLKEQKLLRQFVSILDYIECELQYRLTPLPDLCRLASSVTDSVLAEIFQALARELEVQASTNVKNSMEYVIDKFTVLTPLTRQTLLLLGQSLGQFDISGQIKEIEGVRHVCLQHLQEIASHKSERIRKYRTLGFCTGAVLVIILS